MCVCVCVCVCVCMCVCVYVCMCVCVCVENDLLKYVDRLIMNAVIKYFYQIQFYQIYFKSYMQQEKANSETVASSN